MKTIKYLFLFLFLSTFSTAQIIPKQFDILFKFGFGGKLQRTVFDSRIDTIIVYGIDTIMKLPLKLSSDEQEEIRDALQKIDFIAYPENYIYQHPDSEEAMVGSPCNKYSLTVIINSDSKLVEWNDCIETRTKDEKHAALMKVGRRIEKIIWDKDPLKGYHPKRMLFDPN